MSADNIRQKTGRKDKWPEAGATDIPGGLHDDDPLDIDKAVATRKAMSLGKKVGINRLFANQQSLTKKASILARYMKCRWGPGRLTIEEFLKFGLAQSGARSGEKLREDELQAFVGHAVQQNMHDT
jgi:hypothetical protein